MSDKSKLYTVFIIDRQSVMTDKGREERNFLVTYYDVTWKQIGFYLKKHGAGHADIEEQSRKLDKLPTTVEIEEIVWSAEAVRGSLAAKERARDVSGIPGGGTKSVEGASARKTVTRETVTLKNDYADLVNTMIKEEA
jgi:hypothetical protein